MKEINKAQGYKNPLFWSVEIHVISRRAAYQRLLLRSWTIFISSSCGPRRKKQPLTLLGDLSGEMAILLVEML